MPDAVPVARVAAKHARRRDSGTAAGRGRRPGVRAAGQPAGTVAGRVAGRLPTGVPVQRVRRERRPPPADPAVAIGTVDPPTRTAGELLPAVVNRPSLAARLPAVVVLLIGLVAAASAVLVDLATGGRALAGLVALWGVVVGGFALVRPPTS